MENGSPTVFLLRGSSSLSSLPFLPNKPMGTLQSPTQDTHIKVLFSTKEGRFPMLWHANDVLSWLPCKLFPMKEKTLDKILPWGDVITAQNVQHLCYSPKGYIFFEGGGVLIQKAPTIWTHFLQFWVDKYFNYLFACKSTSTIKDSCSLEGKLWQS